STSAPAPASRKRCVITSSAPLSTAGTTAAARWACSSRPSCWRRTHSIALPNPGLVEPGVLHALAPGHEVAVHRVDAAVPRLDDGRVMVRPALLPLQVPGPLLSHPLVGGQGHGQTVPPPPGVIVDQQPVAAAQPQRVQPGPRVGQVGGADAAPAHPLV